MQLDGIKEYWSFCGEIEDLDVMRFPDTGRFKGIAFITYTTVSFSPMPASQGPALLNSQCLHTVDCQRVSLTYLVPQFLPQHLLLQQSSTLLVICATLAGPGWHLMHTCPTPLQQ